jgi:hypothetical protein
MQTRLGLTAFLIRRAGGAIPEHNRTKGTCTTCFRWRHVKRTTCDCGRYRVFEDVGMAETKLNNDTTAVKNTDLP